MDFGEKEESRRRARREIFPSTASDYPPWRKFGEGGRGGLAAKFFAEVPPFQAVASSRSHTVFFDGRGRDRMVLPAVVLWGNFGGRGREVVAVFLNFVWSGGVRAGYSG